METEFRQTDQNQNTGASSGGGYLPAVDIVREEGRDLLYADMPGVDEKNIDIVLEKNIVTVHGHVERINPQGFRRLKSEYGKGDYSRSFQLSDEYDPDNIQASVKDGVLKVTLPRIAPKRRKIAVSAG
jgi:HSP20 family molecular chaperone IbpA